MSYVTKYGISRSATVLHHVRPMKNLEKKRSRCFIRTLRKNAPLSGCCEIPVKLVEITDVISHNALP